MKRTFRDTALIVSIYYYYIKAKFNFIIIFSVKNNTVEEVNRGCVDAKYTCEYFEKSYLNSSYTVSFDHCSMCDTDLCNGSTALTLSSMVIVSMLILMHFFN